MRGAFYNDNDAYAARWLRNLVSAGHLPPGTVDDRSILHIGPDDVAGYRHCHFFAGIGGWPLALALAGWPEDREVWTGSCPCQPLSSAGQRKGHADERHLWPAFYALIAQRRPATVFGEQVASKDGREWLAGVRADLEHLGYAVGCADLPAAGVGAPHIRQRLFWVADAGRERWDGQQIRLRAGKPRSAGAEAAGSGAIGGLGDAASARRIGPLAEPESEARNKTRLRGIGEPSPWSGAVWLPCLDGKARRVEPTIFPLAHAREWGTGSRVGILRGAGNAIVPQAAATFIQAFLDSNLKG